MEKNDKEFPSHSEIYGHIKKVVRLIKEQKNIYAELMDWALEEKGWDIVIRDDYHDKISLIEYKSSVTEWGTKFDDMIRQIKKRPVPRLVCDKEVGNHIVEKILFSFDERFDQFEDAARASGFSILTIPYNKWEQIKNE